MTDEQFKKLLERIEKKRSEITKANLLLLKLCEERDKNCKHENMIVQEYYFSGSYYDRAYTETWKQCVCCGYKTEKKHETHDWFG